MKKSFLITLFLSCSLIGCVHNELASENLFASLCGNTYKGAVTSKDPQDEDWRKEVLVLGPVNCIGSERVEMPLAVGSNTSRTWFVTGKGQTLELRHQHLHEDGSPDAVSLYGGPIAGAPRLVGDVWTMSFPADQKTIDIFNANDLQVSVTNVWTLEIVPNQRLAYELNRINRNFRAEFDLSQPQ